MAARSGLSSSSSSSVELKSSNISTSTWSELFRRQCRVMSGIGQIEKRIDRTMQKMEKMGWENPNKKTNFMEGEEWAALAQRQQLLLQSICSVKDRLIACTHRIGIENAPHLESVAQPQLTRRVPSHFNNQQIAQFLAEEAERRNRTLPGSQPLYPLTKLLVLTLVRGVQRLISSGMLNKLENGQEDEAMTGRDSSPSSASQPLSSPSPSPSPSPFSPADSAASPTTSTAAPPATLVLLLQRLFPYLVGVSLSYSDCLRVISDGSRLCSLSLQLDRESRSLLHEESYVIGGDNLTPSPAVQAATKAFHEKQARSWFMAGRSPFADFKFSKDPAGLKAATRVPCAKCKRPAALYCPFCLELALPPELRIPPVRLPLNVDIVHHVGENVKKSTSIHACVLSPSQCRFLSFPSGLPRYDPDQTILLYPTADAVFLDDERLNLAKVKTIVVVESTWQKSDVVASHPLLSVLPRVKIRNYESTFWRKQELGRNFLSTLEAIYYAQKEFLQRMQKDSAGRSSNSSMSGTNGSIDDLLYFYAFQHSLISDRYQSNPGAAPKSWSGGRMDGVQTKQSLTAESEDDS